MIHSPPETVHTSVLSIMDEEWENGETSFCYGKCREAGRSADAFSPLGIEVIHHSLTLMEPVEGRVEEVCLEKLRQVRRMGLNRVMVDDAGLILEAYPGFPGVISKRIFDQIGYRGLMKLLSGEPRQAWLEGAVAVLWDGKVRCLPPGLTGESSRRTRKASGRSRASPSIPSLFPTGRTGCCRSCRRKRPEAFLPEKGAGAVGRLAEGTGRGGIAGAEPAD